MDTAMPLDSNGKSMFQIILACYGVPEQMGIYEAIAVSDEFKRRPWHRNVSCTWEGNRLMLRAENDYDANGLALAEEFSDAISVSIAQPFNGEIKIESVTPPSSRGA
jgi:hypothetical protein